ncbi:MAG: YesL family protein [Oscillospiraceae bacterium]|nr:YesL family protein [Oscillospiraceae bacterium]
MFRNLLKPDSPLMITMSQITDCIFLSLFWLVGCFPLVTVGVSTAAMYDATYHGLRKGDKHSWQRFWGSFRRNLKSGILPGILLLIALFCGAWGMIQVWNSAVYGEISWAVFSAAAIIAVFLLGMISVLCPMLSRFENSVSQLLKNTVLLSLANPARTLLLGIVNAVAIFLCVRYIFPLFFLPSLAALIGSLFIEPMFKPYMNTEDAA